LARGSILYGTPNAVLHHPSGRSYTLNSSGVVTVNEPDDAHIGGVGSQAIMLCKTGATADRPTGAPGNMTLRAGAPSVFYDTSLSSFVFYVGAGAQAARFPRPGATARLPIWCRLVLWSRRPLERLLACAQRGRRAYMVLRRVAGLRRA
jgi:hypothetical protein